jgi:hypothetical protein
VDHPDSCRALGTTRRANQSSFRHVKFPLHDRFAYPHSGEAHQANLRLLFTMKAAMTAGPLVAGGDVNAGRHFDIVYKKKTRAKFFASEAPALYM